MLKNLIRSKVGKTGLFLSLVIGILSLSLTALAHEPQVKGKATCGSDGLVTVTWTIKNSENQNPRVMTIDSVTRGSGYVSPVAGGGSTSGTETVAGNFVGTLTNVVTASWSYNPNAPKNVVRTASVTLKGDCQGPVVTPEVTPEITPVTETPVTPIPTEDVTPVTETPVTPIPTEDVTPVTETPVTPGPQPTRIPERKSPEGTGFFICAVSLPLADDPFGGSPWGIWLDEMSHFGGFILVSDKGDYIDIALHTSTAVRSTGLMNIAGPYGYNLDVMISFDEASNHYTCAANWSAPADPAAQPTGRPLPPSGSGELPSGRGGSTIPVAPIAGFSMLAIVAGGWSLNRKRNKVAA